MPVAGAEDAGATINDCVGIEKKPFDFVDGILFSERSGVVCVGRMTETCTYSLKDSHLPRIRGSICTGSRRLRQNVRMSKSRMLVIQCGYHYLSMLLTIYQPPNLTTEPATWHFNTETKESPMTDTILLVDYLFRYDRGSFWMGAYYPLFYFKFLNDPFTRWLFNSYLQTRFLFQSMHISNRSQEIIIEDLVLPSTKTEPERYPTLSVL
jgi:delta24-sterol reductase